MFLLLNKWWKELEATEEEYRRKELEYQRRINELEERLSKTGKTV